MSQQTINDALLASLPPVSYDPQAPAIARETGLAAGRLADAEAFIDAIFLEEDPHRADVTLADWERVLGLPDCCTVGDQTVVQRRAAVVEKWLRKGGISRQWFIDYGARLGLVVTIDELGDFVWRLNSPMVNLRYFRVKSNSSRMGQRLRTWGDAERECRFTKLKPADTKVVFGYV